MTETKRKFESSLHDDLASATAAKPAGTLRLEERRRPRAYVAREKDEAPVSREVILRLIRWLKEL